MVALRWLRSEVGAWTRSSLPGSWSWFWSWSWSCLLGVAGNGDEEGVAGLDNDVFGMDKGRGRGMWKEREGA